MKRLDLVLFTVAMCFVWIVMSSTCEAARQKGKVTAVVKNDTEVCKVLKDFLHNSKEGICKVEGSVSNLVVIKGALPKRAKHGQSVILKVRGMDKVVAKVVFCVRSDTRIGDTALAILKEKGNIIWCSKEGRSCIVLKAEKEFLPSVGDIVSLKAKSTRMKIEGC